MRPPNQALQRTGGQRRFANRWFRRRLGVVSPPPLSGRVRALVYNRGQVITGLIWHPLTQSLEEL
jgi:hypothetical protein